MPSFVVSVGLLEGHGTYVRKGRKWSKHSLLASTLVAFNIFYLFHIYLLSVRRGSAWQVALGGSAYAWSHNMPHDLFLWGGV